MNKGFTLVRKSCDREQGFTLIEVLVASVLMVALGTSLLGLQFLFTQNELTAFNTYSNISEANSVTSSFVNEIRKANSSENGSFALEVLNDYEIVFYSDIDFDSQVERVRYSLNGTVLEKGVIEPTGNPATYLVASEQTKTISQSVRNGASPLFFYYNDDWPTDIVNNPLALSSRLSETQIIRIFVVINNSLSRTREDYALDSFVQPRILKNNL